MDNLDPDLVASIQRTQARIRELEALIAMLAVRHGQEVGLGTRQIRIPEEEAFALRAKLPARDVAVMVSFEYGDFLITCV